MLLIVRTHSDLVNGAGMSNVQNSSPDFSEIERSLDAVRLDLSTAFEECFGCVKSIRLQLSATSAADTAAQALFDAISGFLADADSAGSMFASRPNTNADLNVFRSAVESKCDASQRLQRAANRPMTRLVGAMQSRDAVEQRISHVFEAAKVIAHDASGKAACLHVIVAAQVDGIRDAIETVVATCRESGGSLLQASEAASQRYKAAFDATAAAKRLSAALEAGDDTDATLLDTKRRVEALSEAGNMEALTEFEMLKGQAEQLLVAVGRFGPAIDRLSTCVTLIADLPSGDKSEIADQSDRLFPIYTVDDERAIHKATLDRIAIGS